LKEVALEQAKSDFEQRASLLTNLSDDVSSLNLQCRRVHFGG
jgi:hypothetical protein